MKNSTGEIKLQVKTTPTASDVGVVVLPTGKIVLASQMVEEFHLPGQHDQSSHGKGGGNGSTGGARRAATDEVRLQRNQKPDAEFRADLRAKYGDDVEEKIAAFGHKVEDYNYYTDKKQSAEDILLKKPKELELKGTPLPGTDSWRDAHGISKEVYDARPTVRWKDKNDPVFEEHFGDFTKDQGFEKDHLRFAKQNIAAQSDGFIMVRKPPPGAEEIFGKVPPQARPDQPVVLDQKKRAAKLVEWQSAKKREEQVKQFTPDDVIKERENKVKNLKKDLDEITNGDPVKLKKDLAKRQDDAAAKVKAAEASGDPDKISEAKVAKAIVDREANNKGELFNIAKTDPERARGIVQQQLTAAETSVTRAKADPEGTLRRVQENATNEVQRKQDQFEKTAVKYAFPPGKDLATGKGGAARIEVNQDPQNIKNLTEGKGRVYFVMEGNIKADAALTAVKREDPKAAVMSVPSVTAWDGDEVDWVAKKYLKGRDVILIPDSDGVTNRNVMNQAIKLEQKLKNSGVGDVKLAAPPLVNMRGGKLDPKGKPGIQELFYPTGKDDHRKGLDDHLGLGKGTLGDLTFQESRTAKSFDLAEVAKKNKVRPQAVENMNKSMAAISEFAGESGVGRISYNSIESASGVPSTSVTAAVKNLEKAGLIKVHHIFDPNELAKKRRVLAPGMDEDTARDLSKRAGVNPPDFDNIFQRDDEAHESPAIIEILDPGYVSKPGPVKSLADEYKTLKKSDRKVATPEGAQRYGVPIGTEIPIAAATGVIHVLNTMAPADKVVDIVPDKVEPLTAAGNGPALRIFSKSGSGQIILRDSTGKFSKRRRLKKDDENPSIDELNKKIEVDTDEETEDIEVQEASVQETTVEEAPAFSPITVNFHLGAVHDQEAHGTGGGISVSPPPRQNAVSARTGVADKVSELRGQLPPNQKDWFKGPSSGQPSKEQMRQEQVINKIGQEIEAQALANLEAQGVAAPLVGLEAGGVQAEAREAEREMARMWADECRKKAAESSDVGTGVFAILKPKKKDKCAEQASKPLHKRDLVEDAIIRGRLEENPDYLANRKKAEDLRKKLDGDPKYKQKLRDEMFKSLYEVRQFGAGTPMSLEKGKGTSDKDFKKIAKIMDDDVAAYYPKEWIEDSNKAGKVKVLKVERGVYRPKKKELGIPLEGDFYPKSVAVHEFAHRAEDTRSHIKAAEWTFYQRRTKGEKLEHIGPGYGKKEKAKKDKFKNPYSGKEYSGGGKDKLYEVFSVGMTNLRGGKELGHDPDYDRHILGLLAVA